MRVQSVIGAPAEAESTGEVADPERRGGIRGVVVAAAEIEKRGMGRTGEV